MFPDGKTRLRVVERLHGSATTDFGAPGALSELDRRPFERKEAIRSVALLQAAWSLLDDASKAAPDELRKGPRGGGRDRDPIVQHVADSERTYARKVGIVDKPADLRAAFLKRLATDFAVPAKGWPGRFAARRLIWHVVDHLWEIEDRSG